MHGNRRLPALILGVALVAGACKVGPDYEAPEPFVPDAWKTAVTQDLDQDSPIQMWFVRFNDPQLATYVQQATAANKNLLTAVARVQEARALLGIASGQLVPDVALDAAAGRQELSENGIAPGPEDAFNLYSVGLGASWEIDVFGRIRRGIEAASASLDASIEDYRDVLVVLIADVASNYLTVRTLQARIEYARSNVKAQADTLQLTRDRFNAGLTSARDVAQAESNLANSRATIPALEARLEGALNRLSVLVGDVPGTVDGELVEARPIPEPDEEIAIGMPAELLRRRPDIRRAERLLASQTALVGVATADLYPTFSLTGIVALESTESGSLFESGSVGWSLVPGLRWNLFTGGKIRNRIRAEEARTDQALLSYEQTVLEALGEVETALVSYEREKVRRDRLEEAVDATERTVELVRTQYLSGLTDFQSYLDAQRSLFTQQDQLASSQGQVVQNLVLINRALGGGWDPTTGGPDLPGEGPTESGPEESVESGGEEKR